MGSEWKYISLGELITLQRGHDLPSQNRIEGSIPIMGSSGITGFHNEVKCKGPGVVVGRSGDSMGVVSYIDTDYWPLNTCLYVTDFKGNDARYIYYLLKQIDFEQFNSGSAQKSLNRNAVYPHKVWATEDSYLQNKIGLFISKFEDKITLNRQINQTLEQMAQTLFKSWFVDFDPVLDNALDAGNAIPDSLQERAEQRRAVRAKADFKPLPAETRALFPAEFEETELGWVPKGWEVTTIGSSFDVTMGQSPPGSTYNENKVGKPFFQGKTDFGFRYPTNRVYCTKPKRLAKKHDTLVSIRAPVGSANLASESCAIGRGVAAIRHKSGSASFTYYSIQALSKQFEVFNGEGTVFGSINQKDMNELKLIKISNYLISIFDIYASSIDKKIEISCGQIASLTQMMDSFLPKLISGELSLEALPEVLSAADASI